MCGESFDMIHSELLRQYQPLCYKLIVTNSQQSSLTGVLDRASLR